MASTQEILQAIGNMQMNAQEALPVVPNNGNPGGAHNMPVSNEPQQPVAPPDPYAWLQPSPAMQTTSKLLANMAAKIEREMYNDALSQGKHRIIPKADGTINAQLLTDTGSEFDPYRMEELLPIIPISLYSGLEQNQAPTLPRGP